MKNLKKILLITASALSISVSNVRANVTLSDLPITSSDLSVKLTGFSHFQAGCRNQNHLAGSSEQNVSANRQRFAFYNDAAMIANVSNTFNDITYGGKIVLVPTTKRKGSPSYNGSHIYMESIYGKIEAGSPINAAANMNVDGYFIAAATGDDWSRYADFSTKHLIEDSNIQPSFSPFSEFFLDSKLVTKLDARSYSSEPSRSISYYTPKFSFGDKTKLQAGISYIPDSSNTGADNPKINSLIVDKRIIAIAVDGKTATDYFEIGNSVKDAITGGITLEQNLSDGVDFKVALTGEHGKSVGEAKRIRNNNPNDLNSIATTDSYKLRNLRTFNIGAILNFGNLSCAGSFGSLGKSLTTKEFHKTGQKTNYYTGAVAYKQGPFTTSISYFKSNQFGNIADSVSIGTDCKLAPGIKPYVEISAFSLKGRSEFYTTLQPQPKKTTRGTVALLGAKISL